MCIGFQANRNITAIATPTMNMRWPSANDGVDRWLTWCPAGFGRLIVHHFGEVSRRPPPHIFPVLPAMSAFGQTGHRADIAE